MTRSGQFDANKKPPRMVFIVWLVETCYGTSLQTIYRIIPQNERNGTKVSSRGQLGQNKSLLLCFNTMLKKIFWSNVGAIGPKYSIIKAKLDELLLIL